jgi:S-DNA-T family DNA segregation ATPase FtsK/SpoIIIE
MGRIRSRASYFRREFLALGLLAGAVFLFLSLISARMDDPSWFCIQTLPVAIRNWCGIIGAHCAALVIYMLGGWAFSIPLLMGVFGVSILFKIPYQKEWDRLAAVIMLTLVGSAWCARYELDLFDGAPGGFVGSTLARLSVHWFNTIGTFFVLHGLAVVATLVLCRISFLTAFNWLYRRSKSSLKLIKQAQRLGKYIYLMIKQGIAWIRNLYVGSDFTEAPESIFAFESGQSVLEPQSIALVSPATVTVDEEVAPEIEAVPEADPVRKTYKLPDIATTFELPENSSNDKKTAEDTERARILEEKLACFGIQGRISAIRPGPVVTLYEYEPAIDTKLSKIVALEDDLTLALQATSIRILAPMPGTAVVGFEVANQHRKSVYFGTIMRSKEFKNNTATLPLILGQQTTGLSVIADLARMPHLLVAGSTGSGKSVALHAMIANLLAVKKPDDLKLILIDPKRLEFACYADIPHLLFPVVTDPRMAVSVLRWAIQLMEKRYELMAKHNVRSISEYQQLKEQPEPMPYLVFVIDEFADLMMTAGGDVEDHITRLSQMARAAGIHLILATQRPSVDVITGLIKVNFPSRIALRVTSKIDSRTILDCAGAEKLLGRGDQLFLDASNGQLLRIHGAYVSDREINLLVKHLRAQQPPAYLSFDQLGKHETANLPDADDELYQQIVQYLQEVDEVSISMVQRRFRIGYNRSARIIEALQAEGKILPAEGSKPRRVVRDN